MDGEAIVVIGMLAGIAVMVTVLLLYQRGKERRLAAEADIEIPAMSVWRSVLVFLVAAVAGPVTTAVVTGFSSSWTRENAAVAVLSTVAGSGLLIVAAMRISRGWRRDGLLRYTADQLSLELKGACSVLDLHQPFELHEGFGTGPANMPLQVLWLRQGDRRWGISYGLPIGRKPYGDTLVKNYPTPMLGGETRVIHDRLRGRLAPAQ